MWHMSDIGQVVTRMKLDDACRLTDVMQCTIVIDMALTELLTSTQAGAILGKSSRTVIRLIEAGDITPLGKLDGPNGPYVLTRTAVEDYAAKATAA